MLDIVCLCNEPMCYFPLDFSEVFSKSMNRDQLREWLLHKLGKDHEDNIDKLYG